MFIGEYGDEDEVDISVVCGAWPTTGASSMRLCSPHVAEQEASATDVAPVMYGRTTQ